MTRVTSHRAALILAATLAATGAQAAGPYASQQPDGRYGGGFIEMLMTGREPSPSLRQAGRADPMGQPRGFEDEDPFAPYERPQAPRRRMSALPAQEDVVARRAPSAEYQRQTVSYDGREAPGTIVIDTPTKFLYLVQGDGTALRYGIGVGRPGFMWAGVKTITRKAEWPGWTPPPEMIKRRPDLPRHMEGGPANPLGARALYLGSTLYRIHGTNEPYTIGQNVSSGCIRMLNDDVVDLYTRVGVGTRVKVI